jgi:hypothetical protein
MPGGPSAQAPGPGFPPGGVSGAHPRDRARAVSTSTVTDPFYGLRAGVGSGGGLAGTRSGGASSSDPLASGAGSPINSAAQATMASNDPFISSQVPQPQEIERPEDPAIAAAPAEKRPTAEVSEFTRLRQRLDAAGARNLRSEKDPATGMYNFGCEIPHPGDPDTLRVFETQDPVEDELEAMRAVTDAVERWLADSRQP